MRLHSSTEMLAVRLLTAISLLPIAACGSSTEPTGTGGSTTTTTTTIAACADPKPAGNLVECSGGWRHRVASDACTQPPAGACSLVPEPEQEPFECMTDADCTAAPFGRCAEQGDIDWGYAFCGCDYGCATDADCGAAQVCICSALGGHCVSAACKTDADCPSGALCATAQIGYGECASTTYACQSPLDKCMPWDDCEYPDECMLVGSVRVCGQDECGVGRPFLVAGRVRLAPLAARADWLGSGPPVNPSAADLDPAMRAEIAARWAAQGAMEHASVAAFARFVLQLLSLGAPADLVREAQAAMTDETRHAEVCYAFASAFGGAPIGPGPLAVDDALAAMSPRTILTTAILEGCVGEAVAALEAAETAELALDPAVRDALRAIAEEEARHAELAYRFVGWALATMPELWPAARATFDQALANLPRAPLGDDDDLRLVRHGFAGEGLRRAIRRRALTGVVAPCARAVLGSVARRALTTEPVAAMI